MKNLNLKKRTVILTAIGLSVVVLAAVAFAGATPNAGYQAFKEMMKSSAIEDGKPEQGDVSLSIIDNGNLILDVNGKFQVNAETKQVSGNMVLTTDQLKKEISIYGEKDNFYVVDTAKNQVYVGKSHSDMRHSKYDRDARGDWGKAGEAFLDQMMGDLANRFSLVDDKDGSKDIVFSAKAEELPAWLSLMIAADHDSSDMHHRGHYNGDMDKALMAKYPLFNELSSLENILPIIVDEKQLDRIKLTFDRNLEGQPVGILFNIDVQGKDAEGKMHQLQVNGSFVIGEKNENMTIQPLDITGMEVFELPNPEDSRR